MNGLWWVLFVLGVGGAFYGGTVVRRRLDEAVTGSARERAKQLLEDAEREAEGLRKEAVLEAKEEIHRLRSELDRETRERRSELQRLERRMLQKEETLDRKTEQLERREETFSRKEKELERSLHRAHELQRQQLAELERVSGMTVDEARTVLLQAIEQESRHHAVKLIRDIEHEAKEEAERRARWLVSEAVQRVAADHVSEITVSVVQLPSDEMKGRIIGREGRNIRTLEQLTGVDLIIDDTPEAVILSSFDPIRREVAKIALQKLIQDGRIHPARIEEMVEKAQREVDQRIREEGERAILETGIHGIHPDLVKILGRLHFRSSYGQNVLQHSIEVAHLAGIMAAEMGVDTEVAKRAGLLHDIGKALTHETEGTHVEIGRNLLRKHKESDAVIHAMETHHGDYEPRSVEAMLVTAADAISAARPGARRENLETYIKRLEKLEEIANSYEGVEKSFAIQAGREVRIIVKPDKVDDYAAIKMSRDISKRIEEELEYPGTIKVMVIRETRAVEYAK